MTLYNDVINNLQYYILNEKNIEKILSMKINSNSTNNYNSTNNSNSNSNSNSNNIILQEKADNDSTFFWMKEKDPLFWIFYILKYGNMQYETLYQKNNVFASQIKISYVEKIRKEKQTVKLYKFDTLSNIESNLANDKLLNIKTFLTLCAIENINILYIHNKICYELLSNDNNDIIVIYCKDKLNDSYEKKYGYKNVSKTYASNLKTTLYQVDNINKPLKTMSSYKLEDLIIICKKLAIEIINKENGRQKLKKELYEEIIQYL